MHEETPHDSRGDAIDPHISGHPPSPPSAGVQAAPEAKGKPARSEELHARLRLQTQLLDAVAQAVIATDLDGTVIYWNQCASELYGWSAEEALGRNISEVTIAEGLEQEAEQIMATLSQGQSWQGEFTVRRRDGSRFTAMVADYPIHSESGELVGIVGLSWDISPRKEMERKILEQKEMLERVNAIAMLLSAELDLEKLLQSMTDAATELTGAQFGSFFYNVVDDKGESYMLYTLSGIPRHHFERFPMPRATELFGPTFRGEGVLRMADVKKDHRYGKNSPYYGMPPGHLPVTSYLAVPVISRSGDVLGGLFFGHSEEGIFSERAEQMVVALAGQTAIAIDNARLYQEAQEEIAMRKRTEKEMQIAKDSAERASSAKDQFLAMLSHELRTPLTPVLAAVHVLETDENMPAEFQPFIDIIHRNIEMEARLIDDLLDLTRITKGTLQLNIEQVDIHALAEHVIEIVEEEVGRKKITMEARLDAPRHRLAGDPARLQQVLWNLLTNAVKFTPQGGRITIETANGSDGWLTLRVSDTGVGIEPDRLPYIFNAFDQGERAIGRKHGGLGLGLAISRKIVEMHGGRLTAISSGPDTGSTFIEELPGAME